VDALHHVSGVSIGGMGVGLIWIAGAVYNAVWTMPNARDAWHGLGEDATFGIYRWFFSDVVGAAPVAWTAALVAGEILLGVMLLGKERWARRGLLGSTIWSLFLSFLIWPYTLMMFPFALLTVWLLRWEHRTGILDLTHWPGTTGRGA
jgi:hypothetical protein